MKAYADYKSSGVEWLGEVPSHWQVVKSKNIFGQSSQRALKNDEQLTASQKYGVIPQSLFMEYENQKVVLALTGLDNFKHIDKNDFVISLRSFQGGIELCHYDGCVSPAYTVLKAKSEINNKYFSYLLKDIVYIQALNTAVIGIREGKNISYNNFGEIVIPLPPLAEQQKIAQFLDTKTAQIDALITEQNRLIELLTEQRKTVISHAVTKGLNPNAPMKKSGVEWLGEVPNYWIVAKIKNFLAIPITDGPHTTPILLDDGIPFISAESVKNGKLDFEKKRGFISEEDYALFSKKYIPKRNDIYMVKSGATTGNIAIVETDEKFTIWSPLAVFRADEKKLNFKFLFFFLQSSSFMQGVTLNWSYGTQQNIGMGILSNLPCIIPPLAEQNEIVAYIETQTAQIDALISEQKELIERLKEYRTALISAAVTGKIDVQAV